jgi:(S)-mandelate dehydrogenase
MNLDSLQTIDELRLLAKRRLPRIIYDFIEGGAGDELGVAQSARQYADFRIVPRYLLDVRPRTQQTELFGQSFKSPFGIAPTGYAGVYRVNGEKRLAEAARDADIPIILSGSGIASIETVSAIAGRNSWFQLYAAQKRETSADLIRRAAESGVETLVVTVDIPVPGRRYRNARNGFRIPPQITPSLLLDLLRHPAWTLDYLRSGGLPAPGSWVPYAKAGARPEEVAAVMRENAASPLRWSDIEYFRSLWKGNLVLKGVLHPDDARMAADLGVNGLIVSNHGGRQFDRAPTPVEALPGIVAAVGDRVTIMTDGGITKGSDILIALALGAKFVFTGRATLWGLTAAGLPGVNRALSILRDEVDAGLAQTGALTIPGAGGATLLPPSR